MNKNELDQYFATMEQRLRQAVREEVDTKLDGIEAAIGSLNDEGTGGSGLVGQLARTNARVDELFQLKHVGMGVILSITVAGALILMGIKSWIAEIVR